MNRPFEKPETTRVYFHAPKSERMYTLWREGRVLFSEVVEPITDYEVQPAAAMWFVRDEGRAFEFYKNLYSFSEDGMPPHTLKIPYGRLFLNLECFGEFGRRGRGYVKLTLKNPTEGIITEKLGFYLRSGRECDIIYDSADIYSSYSPVLSDYCALSTTFTESRGVFTDGHSYISCSEPSLFSFSEEKGLALGEITVGAGERVEITFSYDIGKAAELDYDEKRAECVKLWASELERINKLPEKINSDAEKYRAVKNLTVQLLQSFAYPVGRDLLLSRQGGLQRQIWTYESMSVIEALSRIGNFGDYVEPVIDSYFTDYYTDSGEIVPLGISWAMITGTVLYSFSQYARLMPREFFDKYKERAYKSFLWIKATRASTRPSENIAEGLFPPKSSCDDPLVFQSWCNTDTFNIRGLKAYAELLDYFDDPHKEEARAEYEDYLGRMKELWQNISDREKSDEIEVPLSPLVDNKLVAPKFAFGTPVGYVVECLDIDERDLSRILNYYTRRGVIKGGLYNRMPNKSTSPGTKYNLDENGNCTVYYVCTHEYYWFKYFLRHGMRDRCEEIIRDAKRYAMTSEYYMLERYNACDVWFAPWSPNSSANGRFINMLLDF